MVAKTVPQDVWSDRLRQTLKGYTDTLLRRVSDRLLRSRGKRTPGELIDQCVAAFYNPVLLDRRLKELSEPARGLLAYVTRFRRHEARLSTLLELLSSLKVVDGLEVVGELFLAGIFFPVLDARKETSRLRSFEDWLGSTLSRRSLSRLWVHPHVLDRMRQRSQPLPALPASALVEPGSGVPRASDGLDPYLRIGLIRQWLQDNPLRLTQAGDFFKRDLDRLQDPLLVRGWEGVEVDVPEISMGLVAYAQAVHWLKWEGTEIQDTAEPELGHPADLAEGCRTIWPEVLEINAWNPWEGWRGFNAEASPYASVMMLSLHLLAQLAEESWVPSQAVSDWIAQHHCYWTGLAPVPSEPELQEGLSESTAAVDELSHAMAAHGTLTLQEGMVRFLEGWAYSWQLTQLHKDAEGNKVVRLSPLGRHLFGLAPPPSPSEFYRTILIQPNLEMIAYRQGLTPGLILELSRFATWKQLGPACTLLLEPDRVYHGLQSGCSFERMMHVLQKHAVKELPDSVVQALRTWANKRERLAVYRAAYLMEFSSPEDLEAALARGVEGERLTDRFLLIPREEDIDFRHFRLVGTRDYSVPSVPCVELGADGLQMRVDYTKTDLLLEAELERFAERRPVANGVMERHYEMTLSSLQQARQNGLSLRYLEEWFHARVGQSLSPAARLLFSGCDQPPMKLERMLVVQVSDETLADGLMQWPKSRAMIRSRLGPTSLVIDENHLDCWRELIESLPWKIETLTSSESAS